jgi:hypothetical protein
MATSEPASGPPSPSLGARVLVAEDDALVALGLMTTLQAASYVVVGPVSSVAEARTIIDREPPDAALLAGDVPFAVLTDKVLELEPALAGAPRLAKPVRPDALLSMVHDLLKGREAPSPPG